MARTNVNETQPIFDTFSMSFQQLKSFGLLPKSTNSYVIF